MPYLVLDILRDYPGLPGLFVAAAYSGTLRLMVLIIQVFKSAELNCHLIVTEVYMTIMGNPKEKAMKWACVLMCVLSLCRSARCPPASMPLQL